MDNSPKYDVPWELIGDSLTGNLTVEEELQLRQWISSDPANKEKYAHIQDLWKNGLEGYLAYKYADENSAWNALRAKMRDAGVPKDEATVVGRKRSLRPEYLRNLVAIAAIFLGLIGVGLWIVYSGNKPLVYETLAGVEKKVTLKDGSLITLRPRTKIEVSEHFNKDNRTVVMFSGEAYFEVVHRTDKPFTVELGKTLIKDIGTSFNILKGKKEISVSVTSGKVEFTKHETLETRALSAGTKVTFDVQNESFGEVTKMKTAMTADYLLNFDNTPLSDAIVSIQTVFEKKIVLADERIGNKKLTAHLNGMSYNSVIRVICQSLDLEWSVKDGVYILKERK